ncbi:MAG TPA: hypothetical protein DCP02_06790 [Actinobacteria bacterium]|nr:hypothetical protein [Actinomycetota bacterium]
MKKLLTIFFIAALLTVMAAGCTAEDALGIGISTFMILCWGVLAIIGLLLLVLWIVTLVDCIKRSNDEFPGTGENTRTIWLVVLIVTFVVNFWWVAAIVYYFVVMKKMPRKK